ncbi:unnamed protein product [Paramecium pentaurelia]|uniref:Uncharacterized protein n=1 Tax=Paramecium pentaurelia TaxID=43138 RepID=A0A8S1XP21_9CILI|nr:unnamed protein product [Paramecium pentaurelia]
MSYIQNNLCLRGIDELRQVFKQVQPQIKQPNQSREIEVDRVIDTTHIHQNHYHPIFIKQPQFFSITYQPYIIIQNQLITDSKQKKKKKKCIIAFQEQIQVQQIVNRNLNRVESPKITIEKEMTHLKSLIRQITVQGQPSQVLEYNISVSKIEKPKDNSEIITVLQALQPQPIQLLQKCSCLQRCSYLLKFSNLQRRTIIFRTN